MLFEKPIFKNKDKVAELRKKFASKEIVYTELPQDVLAELFSLATDRIDENENGGEYDQRDWKDQACDWYFIVDELFEELESKVKADVYRQEVANELCRD